MSVLDQITTEDNKIDSSEALASKVDINLIKENEFDYKYWLFVFFDYKYSHSANTEEYLKDCFETCPYIRNFCLEYIFDEPEHGYPEYCGMIPGPHIKVMFNMTRENVYSIVRFLSVLLKYIENDKDENRYTITRQINIINWHTETHIEVIRHHFWKFNVIRNYSFDKEDDDLQKLFAPFNINPGEYNDVLEKMSLYDKNRYTLWKMRNKETKNLEIVVNYEYYRLNTQELTENHSEIIPYVVSGKNYSDLIIKLCYLECVGQEQLCTYGDFNYTDRYEGWVYSNAFPLPRLGFDAYDNIRTIGKRQRYEYPDQYSNTYRLIIELARLRENYSVDDCILRMVLPNVVGRIAKRSKYKNEPERLFFDLFSKVDKLDTQSIIQKTLKKTEIINKRRQ